jgi:hypothetical protein
MAGPITAALSVSLGHIHDAAVAAPTMSEPKPQPAQQKGSRS